MYKNNGFYSRETGNTQNGTDDLLLSDEGRAPSTQDKKPFEMEGYTTLFDKAVVLTPVELTIKKCNFSAN